MRDDEDVEDVSGVFEPTLEEAPPQRLGSGQFIDGRYEIVERIGAGGMGQVLRVRHRRLGKPFALKVMLAEFSLDPESCEIFDQEARLASTLSHPSIVSIVDFGEDPDWGLFIVMELVEGELLSSRIDRLGALPVSVVCDVSSQLASALQHSHGRNVVHGDLKPENVACVRLADNDRRQWSVKLLDYGMARLITAPATPASGLGGTPEYLAPERITSGVSAPSVDIYALGILMYEMLTGRVPFSGDEPKAILERQLSEAPEPLSELRPDVAPEIAAIVERALAKEPGERYSDVGQLSEDLQAAMRALGFSDRKATPRATTAPGQSRDDAASEAFDALGVPAAGIAADGTFVVVNRKLRRLLQRERSELEGHSLLDTALAEVHPGFRDDLRRVAMDNNVVRRRISVQGKTSERVHMRVLLTPARGCGDAILTLFPIPAPSRT